MGLIEILVDPVTLCQIVESNSIRDFYENIPDPRIEERGVLAELVTMLETPDRELYHLRFTQGKTEEECATVLGYSQSTISFLTTRLTKRLSVLKTLPKVNWDMAYSLISSNNKEIVSTYLNCKSQENTARIISKKTKISRAKVRSTLINTIKVFEEHYKEAAEFVKIIMKNRDVLERRTYKAQYTEFR